MRYVNTSWRRAANSKREAWIDPLKKSIPRLSWNVKTRLVASFPHYVWITEWAFAVVFIVIIIKWKDLENPHMCKRFQILFFIMFGPKLF